MKVNEKTKLYQVIYQNIENSLQDIREKTEEKKEHLCAVGLGYVAQFCGFFTVGLSLERFTELQDNVWWIPEWGCESSVNLPAFREELERLEQEYEGRYTEQEYDALMADDEAVDIYFDAFIENYQNTSIQVLQDLRKEGKLKADNGEELVVILQYADCHDEDFEEVSFSKINPVEWVPLFANRFKRKPGDNLFDYWSEKYQAL